MSIKYYYEFQQIKHDLKKVEGYSACENIIINNIKKHFELGYDEESVGLFLRELGNHIDQLNESNGNSFEFMNYKYACGFISTLLKTPSWKDWLKTIRH